MQTRSYKDLFRLITSMIGTGGELPGSGTEDTQVADFINRRFQQAFDQSPIWPRYFVSSEERTLVLYELSGTSSSTEVDGKYKFFGINTGSFEDGVGSATADTNIYQSTDFTTTFIYKNSSNAWVVATNINATDTRSSDGKISLNGAGTVQFTEADTTKNDAVEDVTTWTPRTGFNLLSVVKKYIVPYAEGAVLSSDSAKTTIGDFNRIHRKRAFVDNSAIEYEFFVDFDGANILNISNTNDTSVFVSYKKQFTPFTVTSDFYNSTVEVPGEFFNFIAHAVYADFLRVQNRQREAIAEEQVAQTYLALELEKIDIRSNNNTVNKRFSTYVNRQSR
jgi:aspartate 1-decarboxylase